MLKSEFYTLIRLLIKFSLQLYSIEVTMPVKRKDGSTKWIHQKSASAGVKSAVAGRELTHIRYLQVLKGDIDMLRVNQTTIQSRKHQLYTENQTRVGLFAADDKRWVCSDHTTRALGHYRNRK